MKSKASITVLITLSVFFFVFIAHALAQPKSSGAPPNEPAQVKVDGAALEIVYNGRTIFSGRIENAADLDRLTTSDFKVGDAVHQVVTFNAKIGDKPVALSGLISGSEESFPCESDRDPRSPAIVRHSSGLSKSLLNQAVYDRKWDWVLSVDDQPRTHTIVRPQRTSVAGNDFSLWAQGDEVVLRFRPRFYQQHRGLTLFEPWTYKVWAKPIVGWCSWFAFFDKVTEQDMLRTADVLAEVLAPYGYEYLQIDDGYQRGTGLPELWLEPNEKFPARAGLSGCLHQAERAEAGHLDERDVLADRLRRAAQGLVRAGRRGEASPAGTGSTIAGRLGAGGARRPGQADLPGAARGWAGNISSWMPSATFATKATTRSASISRRRASIRGRLPPVRRRRSATRSAGIISCSAAGASGPNWSGLIDGCRLGTDGFSYAGLAQYNSFNNVVWRNDPDHIELSDDRSLAVDAW